MINLLKEGIINKVIFIGCIERFSELDQTSCISGCETMRKIQRKQVKRVNTPRYCFIPNLSTVEDKQTSRTNRGETS